MQIALLKLGVPWSETLDMPQEEADSLLLNYQEIIDPQPQKQKVRKKKVARKSDLKSPLRQGEIQRGKDFG